MVICSSLSEVLPSVSFHISFSSCCAPVHSSRGPAFVCTCIWIGFRYAGCSCVVSGTSHMVLLMSLSFFPAILLLQDFMSYGFVRSIFTFLQSSLMLSSTSLSFAPIMACARSSSMMPSRLSSFCLTLSICSCSPTSRTCTSPSSSMMSCCTRILLTCMGVGLSLLFSRLTYHVCLSVFGTGPTSWYSRAHLALSLVASLCGAIPMYILTLFPGSRFLRSVSFHLFMYLFCISILYCIMLMFMISACALRCFILSPKYSCSVLFSLHLSGKSSCMSATCSGWTPNSISCGLSPASTGCGVSFHDDAMASAIFSNPSYLPLSVHLIWECIYCMALSTFPWL